MDSDNRRGLTLTLLGTGDSPGVPVYGCDCAACERARASSARRRRHASAVARANAGPVLIDAGLWDLRERFDPGTLRHLLMTHYHADHAQGLLELRWGRGLRIAVHGPADAQGFADLYRHPGILDFQPAQTPYTTWTVEDIAVTPVPLRHSKPAHGYCLSPARAGGTVAYLTDTCGLDDYAVSYLAGRSPDVLVLDCSHPPGGGRGNHNDIDQALALHGAIGPRRTVLTHIGHELDCWLMEHGGRLPPNVSVARDGQVIRV